MANPNDTGFPAGRVSTLYSGDINYGDSTSKVLFSLPANCFITDGRIIGGYTAASNSTNAAISVGVAPSSGGLGNEFLNGYSVTQAQGSNFQGSVPWTRFGAQSSNSWTAGSANQWTVGSNSFAVSGKVTGSPGAGSGPWTIVFEVIETP